jgi:hypothetical protein
MLVDQELLRYLFRNSGFGPKLKSDILPHKEIPEFDWDGEIVLSPGLTLEFPGHKCITKGLLDKKIKEITAYLFPNVSLDTKTYIKRIDHRRILEDGKEIWTNNITTTGSNYRLSKDVIVCPKYEVDSRSLFVFYNDLLAIWGNAADGTYKELGESEKTSELIQINVVPKVGDRISCIVYDAKVGLISTGPKVCSDGSVIYGDETCPDGDPPIDCSRLENKNHPSCKCPECPPEGPEPGEAPEPPE